MVTRDSWGGPSSHRPLSQNSLRDYVDQSVCWTLMSVHTHTTTCRYWQPEETSFSEADADSDGFVSKTEFPGCAFVVGSGFTQRNVTMLAAVFIDTLACTVVPSVFVLVAV